MKLYVCASKTKEMGMMWRRARGKVRENRKTQQGLWTYNARDNRCKVSPSDHMKVLATS